MKLKFDIQNKTQPDPYIFADGGRYFLYVTAGRGVEAYSADSLEGIWRFEGIVCSIEGKRNYWAPCIAKINGKYYLYFSCEGEGTWQRLYVASADNPLGPFRNEKLLFDRFSIDAHVVETAAGFFLFYAEDNKNTDRIGTRIFVDRLTDPETPSGLRVELLTPSFKEEMFKANRYGDGKDWYTLEGPFWFEKDGWQYLMYSGACYENDSYHIGYAVAKSTEPDLTKVHFEKHTLQGAFDPLMIKNDTEEGTGHHSVIEIKDQLYIVYHGRDTHPVQKQDEMRTARFCRLFAENGVLRVER